MFNVPHQPIAWSFRRNLSCLCVAEPEAASGLAAATDRGAEPDPLRSERQTRAEPSAHAGERHVTRGR